MRVIVPGERVKVTNRVKVSRMTASTLVLNYAFDIDWVDTYQRLVGMTASLRTSWRDLDLWLIRGGWPCE